MVKCPILYVLGMDLLCGRYQVYNFQNCKNRLSRSCTIISEHLDNAHHQCKPIEWEPIHNLSKESNTDESVLKKLSQHKLDNAFSRLDWGGGGVGLQVGYLWCYSSGLHACIQARDSQALFKLVHGFSDRYTEDQVGFNGSTPLQELLSDSNVTDTKQ